MTGVGSFLLALGIGAHLISKGGGDDKYEKERKQKKSQDVLRKKFEVESKYGCLRDRYLYAMRIRFDSRHPEMAEINKEMDEIVGEHSTTPMAAYIWLLREKKQIPFTLSHDECPFHANHPMVVASISVRVHPEREYKEVCEGIREACRKFRGWYRDEFFKIGGTEDEWLIISYDLEDNLWLLAR